MPSKKNKKSKKHNKRPYPGFLIAVEGLDGSGKSTQLALLRKWFELEGVKVFFTEWNSSAVIKPITKRGKQQKILTGTTFSLIHATDFADRYERQILPLLRAGYIVLCDRYVFTAYARDCVRGCNPSWLRSMYSFATLPDVTFYFRTPLEVALQRILSGRPELKFHEAGMDLDLDDDIEESFKKFQGLLFKEYHKLSKEFQFIEIDSTLPPKRQQEVMRSNISKTITLKDFKQKKHS
jgi:dTMP kinase